MSSEALAWAFKQEVKSSSVKFTLVALCECANYKTGRITPSIAHLCEITGQNRKTVIANIAELERAGLIADTGERCGRTGQIKVYSPVFGIVGRSPKQEAHYVYRLTNPASGEFYIGVRSFLGDPADDSYRGSGNWPNGAAYRGIDLHREVVGVFATRSEAERVEANMIGEAIGLPLCRNIKEESHKRDTNPKTGRLNSPKNGRKQSQKRDTEPSLEPSCSTEPKGSSEHSAHPFPCPPNVDPVDWAGLVANRKAKRAPRTEAAHRGIIRKLDAWEREGWPPGPIVAAAAERGWATVFETDEMKGKANGKANRTGNGSGDGRSSLARAIDEGLDWLGGPQAQVS